jgi:hypothetical protein
MWITLFSLGLAAAACFGVTAVILTRSKYHDLTPASTAAKGRRWR